jgi:hypothetical protein
MFSGGRIQSREGGGRSDDKVLKGNDTALWLGVCGREKVSGVHEARASGSTSLAT